MPRISESSARQVALAPRALAEATDHETRYPVHWQATLPESSPASITPFGSAFPSEAISHSHYEYLPLPTIAFSPTSTSATPALEQRKSTCPGDRDHVKRPPNAFMLFRSAWCKAHSNREGHSRINLNTSSSEQWKALSPEQKKEWETFARMKEDEHKALHPNWEYHPQRRDAKSRVSRAVSSSLTASQRRKRSVLPQQGVAVRRFVLCVSSKLISYRPPIPCCRRFCTRRYR
ncbi:hypothetical protein GGX14DRAFT_510462 [Mycena pura]|uniref:HMG box domain-containing protein n=1 Tax=Mycena pura TaxID=153505 RepID=A0AAD7E4A8_9AGAR|nr:hypothetical protein GGX14DRAFT_510462 [Mycena pura]